MDWIWESHTFDKLIMIFIEDYGVKWWSRGRAAALMLESERESCAKFACCGGSFVLRRLSQRLYKSSD
jgi:hypothetical protein